jgi:hypothetical protein
MFKRLLALGLGVAVVGTVAGCDEETIAKVAPDAAKMFTTAQGFQGGDLLMDQIRDRDELRDGTASNCPYSGDGICDGMGPYGGSGSGSGGSGGDGDGDQLRRRDGSCQP